MKTGKIQPQAVFNFQLNYLKQSFHKANISTQLERQKAVVADNQVSPETLGQISQRFNIQKQQSKSVQDRFMDIFA